MINQIVKFFRGESKEVQDLQEIEFITIDYKDMVASHGDALWDLYTSKKHGFLIKNFLNEAELRGMQKFAIENQSREVAKTEVGYTYPMIFQEFSLRNQALTGDQLKVASDKYFERNMNFNHSEVQEMEFNLYEKVNEFFTAIAGGRKAIVPSGVDGVGQYLFGNFRHLHPNGGLMSVHCGNFFGTKFELIYKHLCEEIKVVNQMSYFIMVQKPEVGGQLSVFNLRWIPGQDKEKLSEDEVVILSDKSKINIDKHPMIKRIDMVPEPGDMILFQGGNIWHRVAKVFGAKERITFGGFMGVKKDDSAFYYWT